MIWIDIKDQLPEIGVEVLIYNGEYYRVAARYKNRIGPSFRDMRTHQTITPRATYWAMIEGPKEQGNE